MKYLLKKREIMTQEEIRILEEMVIDLIKEVQENQ